MTAPAAPGCSASRPRVTPSWPSPSRSGRNASRPPIRSGRVTAETVTASVSLPPWANSAMDGYAVRSADTAGATEDAPVELRVIGDIAAGAAPDVTVVPGTAVRIATGARLPEGADAVVPVEDTTPLDAAGRPGPRGRDATGPVPAACLVHVAVPSRAARSAPPAATSGPVRPSSRPGRRSPPRP